LKRAILFVIILTMTQTAYSQKIILYRNTGGDQVFDLSTIDSIKFLPFTCGDSITYGGKIYHSVLVGAQCWLKENLDIGTLILGAENQSDNELIEKYCYNNDLNNCDTYGGLYQWDEAMQYVTTEGAQGICPDGWHVPTRAEFFTLSESVGWDANALKREDQDGNSTNTSGFSALYAGNRYFLNFLQLGDHSYFWSTTQEDYGADYFSLSSYPGPYFNYEYKFCGLSIRCIKE